MLRREHCTNGTDAGDRDGFGDGNPDIEAVPAAVAHPKETPQAPAGAGTTNHPGGGKTG